MKFTSHNFYKNKSARLLLKAVLFLGFFFLSGHAGAASLGRRAIKTELVVSCNAVARRTISYKRALSQFNKPAFTHSINAREFSNTMALHNRMAKISFHTVLKVSWSILPPRYSLLQIIPYNRAGDDHNSSTA